MGIMCTPPCCIVMILLQMLTSSNALCTLMRQDGILQIHRFGKAGLKWRRCGEWEICWDFFKPYLLSQNDENWKIEAWRQDIEKFKTSKTMQTERRMPKAFFHNEIHPFAHLSFSSKKALQKSWQGFFRKARSWKQMILEYLLGGFV